MSKRLNVLLEDNPVCHKKLKIDDDGYNFNNEINDRIVEDVKSVAVSYKQDTSDKDCSILSSSSTADLSLEDNTNSDDSRCCLLNLSDDVLLIILKKLHPFDLLRISRTCSRLNVLCHDRTLWIDVDFRHDVDDIRYTNSTVDFDNFIEFLLPNTRSIKKSGAGGKSTDVAQSSEKTTQFSISPSFLKKVSNKVRCLKSLTLENHTIHGPEVTLECFPSTLEYLSFKDSFIIIPPMEKSYFFKIDKILPNLTVLDLSGCKWFKAHSFMALSKITHLRELYLKGCLGVEDCVPYASLAATFGFDALELLDLRLTPVNDSDISCFNRVKNLKVLHLEASGPDCDDKITDLGVTAFGSERFINANLLEERPNGVAFILIQNPRSVSSSLETLVIRNYRSVTDISLKHAAGCLLNLKRLDIRGTCCTQSGVNDFRFRRPDVELLTDFNPVDGCATVSS